MSKNETPLGSRWQDIGSDYNWKEHGGLWSRASARLHRYWVIRFENSSEWGDDLTDKDFHCDLQEVDLTSPTCADAYDVPADGLDEYGDPIPLERLVMWQVSACSMHGAYAPIKQQAGRNAYALLRAMRSEAHRLDRSASAYRSSMARPVNAIGSTAREYQRGNLASPIARGLINGDPKAELMFKLGMGRAK